MNKTKEELEFEKEYNRILIDLAKELKELGCKEIHHCIDVTGDVTFSAPSDIMGEMDVEIEYTAKQIMAIAKASEKIARLCEESRKV